MRPAPKPDDAPRLVFQRGRSYPRAIAWLGFRSFWGHLWHLAASVIATGDIDARDWMEPADASDLTARAAAVLGATAAVDISLAQALERDVWVDFIADTGDDADVSRAVAEILFERYVVSHDGEDLELPRGDILLFGGDTAYPVATDAEIHNRLCVPFNQVLEKRDDGKKRLLLGIPGNHDWYDGLDGFARMFRARRGKINRAIPSDLADANRTGQLGHIIDWVEAFRIGKHIAKRPALPLVGYTPVQPSSYFALNVAPNLDLWGVDRQLRTLDFGQRSFFMEQQTNGVRGVMLALADPIYAFLEPNRVGQATLAALHLDMQRDAPLVLTGDTHHYCRQEIGGAQHVIAGGGGAFLHPARIRRRTVEPPAAEFPGPRASVALAMQVPWQITAGRAGLIPHAVMALLYSPIFFVHLSGRSTAIVCAVVALVATIGCSLMCGWRQERVAIIAALSCLCGAWIGVLPYLSRALVEGVSAEHQVESGWHALIAYLLAIYPAVFGIGTLLMVVTLVALEQHQAFSALAHPGFKHFVRLRIRRDGSAVDAWVLGKVDTLNSDEPVALVDSFTWRNPKAEAGEET